MKPSKIVVLLAILTFFLAFGFNLYKRSKTKERPAVENFSVLNKYFSGSFVVKPTSEKYFEVYSKKNLVGYCFYTFSLGIKKSGYGGPINLLIVLDPSLNILGIEVVSHNETPPYVTNEKLNKFLEQFLKPQEKIETITGATITSNTILEIVKESISRIDKFHKVRSIKISQNVFKKKLSFILISIFMTFVIISFLKKKEFLRVIGLFVSIFLIGFWTQSTISLVNIVNILTLRFIPLSEGYLFYFFLGLNFILIVLFGRFYCGWICPFGAVQELVGMLLKSSSYSTFSKVEARKTKYFFLWLALVLALVFDVPNFANYEPFGTFFMFKATKLFLIFTVIVLIGSIFFSRFYCLYFCPVGVFFGIISKFSILKIKTNKNCNFCRKCVKICPVGAIELKSNQLQTIRVLTKECIQCNKCITFCNSGGITRSI